MSGAGVAEITAGSQGAAETTKSSTENGSYVNVTKRASPGMAGAVAEEGSPEPG